MSAQAEPNRPNLNLRDRELIQLGQPLSSAAPRFTSQPPFLYSLTARHGEGGRFPGQDPRISGASDMFSMGVHVGTHMDALSHCAVDGCLHDGTNVYDEGVQSNLLGVRTKAPQITPILAPAVLLDFPQMLGVERVPATYEITAELIDECAAWANVSIDRGDVVLLRTGWDKLWGDPGSFLSPDLPGPVPSAAQHLIDHGVVATGSDTAPFERAPGLEPLRVHSMLLVQAGIFIFECLDLTELSARRAFSFMFCVNPLRIVGATGSPVNPIAIV